MHVRQTIFRIDLFFVLEQFRSADVPPYPKDTKLDKNQNLENF